MNGILNNKKDQRGITLLEMIFAISIFSIVIVTVVDIFQFVIRGNNRTVASQEIQDNFRFCLEMMAKELRMAKDLENTIQCQPNNRNASNQIFNSYDNDIYFKNENEECVVYKLENKRIMISRDGGSNFLPVTSEKVEITNLKFKIVDNSFGEPVSKQPKVTIFIQAEIKPSKKDSPEKIRVQTTISSRQINF